MLLPQDLGRAQVDACDAVFILCNKAPADAKQEDLQTVMTCLAIGQYIQVRIGSTARLCLWHSQSSHWGGGCCIGGFRASPCHASGLQHL